MKQTFPEKSDQTVDPVKIEPFTASPAKKPKPKRVTVTNTKIANGVIGATANPLAEDVSAWIAKGWTIAT